MCNGHNNNIWIEYNNILTICIYNPTRLYLYPKHFDNWNNYYYLYPRACTCAFVGLLRLDVHL